jgi:hypothetical protein
MRVSCIFVSLAVMLGELFRLRSAIIHFGMIVTYDGLIAAF